MYLLETANIMFLSLIRVELLSLECGIKLCGSFVTVQSSFSFTQRYSISFPFIFPYILSISGKPHLFSWEILIVQPLCVHLKERKAGWK